jgi:hypothetical protein
MRHGTALNGTNRAQSANTPQSNWQKSGKKEPGKRAGIPAQPVKLGTDVTPLPARGGVAAHGLIADFGDYAAGKQAVNASTISMVAGERYQRYLPLFVARIPRVR